MGYPGTPSTPAAASSETTYARTLWRPDPRVPADSVEGWMSRGVTAAAYTAYDVIVGSPARATTAAGGRGFGGVLSFGLFRVVAAVQLQGERFRDTVLATCLAFGVGKGLRQFGDPLLLGVLVFPMLLAGFHQLAVGGFQIQAGLIHLRMGSVFNCLDVLLPTLPFPRSAYLKGLHCFPQVGVGGHECLVLRNEAFMRMRLGS